MLEPGDPHCVEPCDICGAVVYPEVIATCIKCKVNRAHVYCMRVFIKEVPDDWVCEICDSGNDSTSFKYVEDRNVSRSTGFGSPDRTGYENTHSTSPYRWPKSPSISCSRSQKVGGTGKVKFIPEEEAIRLCGGIVSSKSFPANPSTHKINGQSTKVSAKVSSMNVKPNSCPSTVGHGKPPGHNVKVSFVNVKPNPSPSSVGHGKLPGHNGVQKTTISNQQTPHSLAKDLSTECDWRDPSSFIRPADKEETSGANALKGDDKALNSRQASSLPIQTEAETLGQQLEKHTVKKPYAASQVGKLSPAVHPIEILNPHVEMPNNKEPSIAIQVGQSSPVVDSGVSCATGECNKSNIDERNLRNNQMDFKLNRCCIPSSPATWKGGFKFQSAALCELYDGLEALSPCSVHRKAYVYSCKLPAVLDVEPLPISNVLIDLFQNDCPGLEDVALYFFPSVNCERSRQYLNLIFEFLHAKNAMLKSVVDGVELLVFTSKQLDEDSQGTIERLNAKNFLWGVFRPQEAGRAIEELTDSEAVDMDIDMVGGQDVLGRIDSVQNLSVRDKISFTISPPTKLIKNIKTEFPFDKVVLKSVQNFEEIAPPGFEGVHELEDSQPVSLKSKRINSGVIRRNTSEKAEDKKTLITSNDLNLNAPVTPSLSADLRKNIKVEFPFDKFPLKSVQDYYKIMDRKDAPPGFEGVQEVENLEPPSQKLKRVCDLY